jgi:hypothetical protein
MANDDLHDFYYRKALGELRGPITRWVLRSRGRDNIIETWREFSDEIRRALAQEVADTMGGPQIAYRVSTRREALPDRDDWGGYSMTTSPDMPLQYQEWHGSKVVRAFRVQPRDVLLHWDLPDPFAESDLKNAIKPLKSANEQEIILRPDANPDEMSLSETPLH